MKPYREDSSLTIWHGDNRQVLPLLPEKSVQCVVTSPPYFGLRDYGTARWEGGGTDCDHLNSSSVKRGTADGHSPEQPSRLGSLMPFKSNCGKCGALRIDQQIGLEATPAEFVAEMVNVFREVRRVLRDDGTIWINLGDTYANDGKWGGSTGGKHAKALHGSPIGRNRKYTGLKPKDLIGIPWRVAFALQDDGWWLRSDIVWAKTNPMPEPVLDRPTRAHEYIFLLSKSQHYYYDADAIREPLAAKTFTTFGTQHRAQGNDALGGVKADNWGRTVPVRKPKLNTKQDGHGRKHAGFNARWDEKESAGEVLAGANKRDVWTVASKPYPDAHFATFPPDLIEPCIKAGCPPGGTVLDPFAGSGTTLAVAEKNGCKAIGIELNLEYCKLIEKRLRQQTLFAAQS